MDQNVVVEADIALGKEFAELLRRARGVHAEAAFWWRDEDEWEFIVATPLVHKRGRLVAYDKIEEALGAQRERFQSILNRLRVLSPSEGLITALDVGSFGRVPLNRPVVDEAVRGVYVPAAYFYWFAPKTLAPA